METTSIILISLTPIYIIILYLLYKDLRKLKLEKLSALKSYTYKEINLSNNINNIKLGVPQNKVIYFVLNDVSTWKANQARVSATQSVSRSIFGFNVSFGRRYYVNKSLFIYTKKMNVYFTDKELMIRSQLNEWKYKWKDLENFEYLSTKKVILRLKTKAWPVKLKFDSINQTIEFTDHFNSCIKKFGTKPRGKAKSKDSIKNGENLKQTDFTD